MSWRLSVDDSTETGDAPGGGGWAAASPFGGGLASLRSMTRVAADAGKAAAQRGRAALNEDGLRGVAAKVAQKTTAVAREGLQTALERAAALSGGCDAEARGAAEAALGRLRDPEAVRQREREARAAAAEARLGGLTPAQKAFMLRSKAGSSLKR